MLLIPYLGPPRDIRCVIKGSNGSAEPVAQTLQMVYQLGKPTSDELNGGCKPCLKGLDIVILSP